MSIFINQFKQHPLYKRQKETKNMMISHPHRCPIFIAKLDSDEVLPDIEKHKYLVPYDFTMAQFLYTIRRSTKISPEIAMFLFIHNIVVTSYSTIGELYEDYKNEDGFLYITYAGENTFG
jgi:GABA(A) receptor-associated protein